MRRTIAAAPALLFMVGLAAVWSAGRQETAPLSRPLRDLPAAIAGVAGEERPLSDKEVQVVGVSDYLFRVFRQDSLRAFSVYVGYYESQATGRTIHSPRNCLPGAGWQVVESGTRGLALRDDRVTVNRYIIANGPVQALVLYWYQGRGRVSHSEYRVKWELLRDAATRGRTEEALVRVMVPLLPSQESTTEDWRRRVEDAERRASQVAEEMLPLLDGALPAWAPVT
jgi:EpsI family protein